MRIYLYDDQRISTGEHVDIEDLYSPVPANATNVQPPETVGDEAAHWNGKVWTVLPERPPLPEPAAEPTQFQKDQSRYQKRAAVKDDLMAYMAADNMSRVRSGVWSVADLTALLDDPAVVAANTLMGTLSFELAAQQIQVATAPLLTPEIKADWTSRLEAHYYLEG